MSKKDKKQIDVDIPFYKELIEGCRDDYKTLRTAVVHPVSANTLQGAVCTAHENLLEPVLIGPQQRIEKAAKDGGIDIARLEIIDTKHSDEAAKKAVELARAGKVDALMKGHIHTDELLEYVTAAKGGLRTGRRMSHIFAIDVPHDDYPKPLWLSDAALNIEPSLQQKKDIVQNAIDLFQACGFGTPKVAIVSATEQMTGKIPSTLEAAALCKMAQRGDISGGVLDGPLAFDNAISKEAAETKGIKSSVAGDVDILIVPDLVTGNMLYKQMKYLSGYNAAGLIMGARVPVILTSRAGGIEPRLASAALAVRYINCREKRI